MQTQTNTSGVDFVLNYLQAAIQQSSGTNGVPTGNSVTAVPVLMALDSQNALQQSGRLPGGPAYNKPSNAAFIPPNALGVVASNTNAGIVALSGIETRPSKLGTTKSGAFVVEMNGTNAVVVPLTNTAVNTAGQVGDTVFATWFELIFYNLTGMGIDNTNAASCTVAGSNTNGANIGVTPVNATGGYTLAGGGGIAIAQNWNGVTVNAANANITITPTASGVLGVVVCGQ